MGINIFSSPEPVGSQGELLVYPLSRRPSSIRPSVCRAFTISDVFFSETPCQIKAKFYMESPWVGGMKVCSLHLGHTTKMAAMPIYGKNPSKIFFSRTGRPISTKLGVQHRGILPIIACSNNDPGVTLTYFTARSNLVTFAFLQEKLKTVDFSETIAASDLKVGRSRHLIDFMKVSVY